MPDTGVPVAWKRLMELSTNEILGLVAVAVILASLVGGYMVISRKNRWM